MNKKSFLIFIVILILSIFLLILLTDLNNQSEFQRQQNNNFAFNNLNTSINNNVNKITANTNYYPPITDFQERVTKKPFGIYIALQDSPVQPERFQDYHTGVDFEILPGEENIDVPIYAFCDGKITMKEYASGYGGILVESCIIENQSVTVIYGHLKLASINKNIDDNLVSGEMIGILGKGYSTETDGERKHLHFGIHKGSGITILGYVQNEEELIKWINPLTIL